jgi:hypothetical protein
MSKSTLQTDLPAAPNHRYPRLLGAPARWLNALDRILRGEATRPSALQRQSIDVPVAGLTLTILVLALSYGFCMGMFPGLREQDPSTMRWVACTVKIPALFFFTLCVTFPSLYVVNALVGSRLRVMAMLQLLIAALAVNLAVLASVGPIVAFFSFGTKSGPFMILLNVLMFTVSGFLGMIFLLQTLHRLSAIKSLPPELVLPRESEPVAAGGGKTESSAAAEPVVAELTGDKNAEEIIRRSSAESPSSAELWYETKYRKKTPPEEPSALDAMEGHVLGRHVKTVFYCWTVIFSVVGAQMAWVLRPYFGSPGEAFVWFGPRSSNFFEGVWQAVRQLLT